MTPTTFIDIVFAGPRFRPQVLKEKGNLALEVVAEAGEMATKGRYKGRPSPYGLALLKVSAGTADDINPLLNETLNRLMELQPLLVESGVEEITLDLEHYVKTEGQIKMDKDLVRKISALNANIDFSFAA